MRIQTSIFVLVLLASTSASADRKRRDPKAAAKASAKAHMEKASLASQEGRNEDALKELDTAWELDPQPVLLVARGHIYVKLDRCEDAIKLYEQYLATNPAQDLADSTNEAIETCKAKLAPPPPPAEPPKSIVTSEQINADAENPTLAGAKRAEPQHPTTEIDAPTQRSWFKDPILIGLGAGGAISIAAGVVLYSSARGKLDDAETASSYDEGNALVDDAHSLRTYSIVCGVAGAALVGGAVFYYLRNYTGDEEPRVTLIPTHRGGVVGWVGRF
jgi:tetratricopeptide (TPR) repeat protein